MKLENLNLTELNAQEMMEIEGGAILKITGLLSALFGQGEWSDVEIEIFGIRLI